ncbi:solute carrier family 23 protein, partial [Staphylococcus aureus]|uniref:solute carrier family 23 protein n=1 Tax=Staphylococcus aureus TaxID=1280 RepID=UPI003D21F37D
VFLLTLLLLIVLYVRKVKGAILIAIVSGTVLAVIVEAVARLGQMTDVNPTGWKLNVPSLHAFHAPIFGLPLPDLFGGFTGAAGPGAVLGLILLVFSLLLSDFFDTMGTMVAVAAEGNMLQEDGNPPHSQEILLVDSVAAIAGGVGSV